MRRRTIARRRPAGSWRTRAAPARAPVPGVRAPTDRHRRLADGGDDQHRVSGRVDLREQCAHQGVCTLQRVASLPQCFRGGRRRRVLLGATQVRRFDEHGAAARTGPRRPELVEDAVSSSTTPQGAAVSARSSRSETVPSGTSPDSFITVAPAGRRYRRCADHLQPEIRVRHDTGRDVVCCERAAERAGLGVVVGGIVDALLTSAMSRCRTRPSGTCPFAVGTPPDPRLVAVRLVRVEHRLSSR